jgi:hypothetical protein
MMPKSSSQSRSGEAWRAAGSRRMCDVLQQRMLVSTCQAAPLPPCTNALCRLPTTHAGSGPSRFNSSLDAGRSSSPYAAPPPASSGRKSTLLAICRQLPPSMQRAEWCLDDYVITDKLYKGYASMGEQRRGERGGWLTARQQQPCADMRALSRACCTAVHGQAACAPAHSACALACLPPLPPPPTANAPHRSVQGHLQALA